MSIIQAIFAVFTSVGEWLVQAVNDLTPMFWNAETGLTLMGTLAVVGLAFSVVFLILGIIQRFLHFRG